MTLHERRLQIALAYLVEYAPATLDDSEVDEQYAQALANAKVILKCLPSLQWLPDDDGTSIDERPGDIYGDVYFDGIWQPDLIAKIEATCILSEE